MILTADVGSGNERIGVGFWARSTKEQAFMIKVYYPHGDQRMMLLGIYSATIPMVYTMNTYVRVFFVGEIFRGCR